MSDTPNEETPTQTPPSILEGALSGAFSGFINTVNPLAGLGALIAGTTIGEATKDVDKTKDKIKNAFSDFKVNLGLTFINGSLIVLGIVLIILAIYVAIGQDAVGKAIALIPKSQGDSKPEAATKAPPTRSPKTRRQSGDSKPTSKETSNERQRKTRRQLQNA